jgi:hypothetical protein
MRDTCGLGGATIRPTKQEVKRTPRGGLPQLTFVRRGVIGVARYSSSNDKGQPSESRGRKATGPRSPPQTPLRTRTKELKTAELPNGWLGVLLFGIRG